MGQVLTVKTRTSAIFLSILHRTWTTLPSTPVRTTSTSISPPLRKRKLSERSNRGAISTRGRFRIYSPRFSCKSRKEIKLPITGRVDKTRRSPAKSGEGRSAQPEGKTSKRSSTAQSPVLPAKKHCIGQETVIKGSAEYRLKRERNNIAVRKSRFK